MATFEPIYRLRVAAGAGFARNANGTLNLVGSTLLTPIVAADHSDEFKVSTQPVTGYQTYLDTPRGRRGRMDFLTKRTDTGRLTIRILDKKVSTPLDNFKRWVTAFVGDTDGRRLLEGKEAYVEESTDNGSVFNPFYVGRIQRVNLNDRLWISFDLYDLTSELSVKTFRGVPTVSYAHPASLLPIGIPFDYGPFQKVGFIPANVGTGSIGGLGTTDTLVVDQTKLGLSDADRNMLLIVKAMVDKMSGLLPSGLANLVVPNIGLPGVTCHVKLIGGSRDGEVGQMTLRPFVVGTVPGGLIATQFHGYLRTSSSDNHSFLEEIAVSHVDAAFQVSNWDTTTVEFALLNDGDATEDTPILINDIHPVQLWADILDGKFGPFDNTGAVRFSTPRDVTAFDTLIADLSFPLFRGTIKETEFADEWIEKAILPPYNLGFYRDGEGKVVPVDLRSRDTGGISTLNNSDLIAPVAPRSGSDIGTAVTDVAITYRVEVALPREDFAASEQTYPDIPPFAILEGKIVHRAIDIGNPNIPPQSPINIDAFGFRVSDGIELEQGVEKRIFYAGKFDELVQQLRAPYGAGAVLYTLQCRRTTVPSAVAPGSLLILDIDELQDPSTVRRGGPRLGRALNVVEQGIGIAITFLDLGVNVTASVPTLGAMSQVTGETTTSVEIPITALNGDLDPVFVHIALTSTAVGTRPVEASPLWFLAGSVESVASVFARGVPANTRVWARGRSEPNPTTGGGGRLPSSWVFPTGDGRIDTAGITAPSALTAATIGGAFVIFTFTPGDTDLPTEVFLNGTRVLQLPAGSDEFTLKGLVAGFLYNSPGAQVRHINPITGGISAFATVTFTTLGTAETAPAYIGAVLIVGESG